MGISRTYSNQFVKPGRVDSTRNLNSEWLNNPQVAVAYLLGIVISKMVLQVRGEAPPPRRAAAARAARPQWMVQTNAANRRRR